MKTAKKPRSNAFKSLVRGSGKDSREEAPQVTTEHLVANIYLSQQSNLAQNVVRILLDLLKLWESSNLNIDSPLLLGRICLELKHSANRVRNPQRLDLQS